MRTLTTEVGTTSVFATAVRNDLLQAASNRRFVRTGPPRFWSGYARRGRLNVRGGCPAAGDRCCARGVELSIYGYSPAFARGRCGECADVGGEAKGLKAVRAADNERAASPTSLAFLQWSDAHTGIPRGSVLGQGLR